LPCALALSGWDPSGAAGAAADLRAFARAGVWGCAALTLVTVQSTAGLRATDVMPASRLLAQAREILLYHRVRALKLGALGSSANARAVERLLDREARGIPLVMDPVLGATIARRGALLAHPDAISAIRRLSTRATVVTPNAPEAEALTGLRVRTVDEATRAAREIVRRGARAALVKGGHLQGPSAVDVLAVGSRVLLLAATRFRTEAHGTGCTLASLLAGKLAARTGGLTDEAIVQAARWAKQTLTEWLRSATSVGDGLAVLGAR
jgi:hydroxymethylpyrimidine/phosphomethylpyrimidine kinase